MPDSDWIISIYDESGNFTADNEDDEKDRFFKGEGKYSRDNDIIELIVLPNNWTAVECYRLCRMEFAYTLSGTFPIGFSLKEIKDAMDLLEITGKEKRLDVIDRIKVMESVVIDIFSERNKKSNKGKS